MTPKSKFAAAPLRWQMRSMQRRTYIAASHEAVCQLQKIALCILY